MNKKIDIKKICSDLLIEIDDNQAIKITNEIEKLLVDIESLKYIDTNNVKPTNFSFDKSCSQLREDEYEADNNTNSKKYLKNANKIHKDYVVVGK